MLKLQTKYFGEVDYDQEDIISFPSGLFGFEEEQEFLLMPFEGSAGNMLCLQSRATSALAFVVMNPFALDPTYEPELQPDELKSLRVEENHELGYYVMCVVKQPVSESTVNLKCPLAIHPQLRVGRQVILDTEVYQMRHPLAQFASKEDAAPC